MKLRMGNAGSEPVPWRSDLGEFVFIKIVTALPWVIIAACVLWVIA